MKLLAALLFTGAVLLGQPPTPESVLGHKPGDDFFLATYDESLGYFQKLSAASDRVRLARVGKTSRGADWQIAIISSPQNLRDFENYRDTARRLALVKGLNDAQARDLARSGKVIVHIDGGLHATEAAGAQHTIQLAYKLATAKDAETVAILDNVILLLWFSINPDGQNQVATWYRANVGTPYEVSNHPGLYQEYVGHDNNRDGYMNNMLESQVVTKAQLEYYPTVFYNHHQAAPFPARIWIPPFGDPVSLNAHPLMYRWVNLFGTAMAAYLDEHDMPGAMHRGRFDDWYPGFIDHVNNFRNTVSFLTETALYRYATPHFYTLDEFPREKQELRTEVFYSSPWRGGWWRLGDAVRYMTAASMAVLDTASKNREELLFDRYRAGRDVVARFTKDPPYAYVIPREQRDRGTAAVLVEKLITSGIEMHQATREFRANGRSHREGDWVVLMDQPFAGLVKELFDLQKYPDLPGAGGRGAATPAPTAGGRGAAAATPPTGTTQVPYDVTGWTLPVQMGVEVVAVAEPVGAETQASLQRIERVAPIDGKVEGSGPVFSFSRNANASIRAVNDLLAAGMKVSFAKTEPTIFAAGDAAAVLRKNGVDAASVKEAANAWTVAKPRVAIYEPWSGSIDQGWTRWVLEQFHFGFARMNNPEVQAGHLREKYDTIVFAEMGARQIMDGVQAGSVPGQYAGGIGEAGAQALREFVEKGGTVVTLGNASLFAIEQFNLAVTNVVAGLSSAQFFCSGSILRTEIADTNHPVTAGLPARPAVMFERNPVFETKTGFRGKVLANYIKDRTPLVSGFLIGADRIQGKAAALDAIVGQGHVILIGFRPQWRGQSHGTYKFLFNALYYNSTMTEAAPQGPTAGGRGPAGGQAAWHREAESVKGEIAKLLELNRTYFTARGPKAAEEGKALEAALDAFQRDRIPLLDDLRAQVEDAAAARSDAAFSAQLKRLAADLRTKDLSGSKLEDLMEQYKLAVLP